ncbi:hypothetical protein D3C87_279820 [compost metagenome]
MNTAANKNAAEGKTNDNAETVKHTEIHIERSVDSKKGKISSFFGSMSKSIAVSLAGIAGIAIGAGGAVVIQNRMHRKEAEAQLDALDHGHQTVTAEM